MTNTPVKLDPRYWKLSINASMASYLDAAILISAGIALPLWTERFSMNTWWVGALSTILTLSVAVGSFFGGRLSDRFGRVMVFNLDILFVVIGALVVAFAPNLAVLVAGIVIVGLASGADLPTSLAVISERVPERFQGKIISSTELFWLGGIVIPQGVGFLVAGIGYAGIYVMFGLIALIALITWLVRIAMPSFKVLEDELLAENAAENAAHGGNGDKAYPLSGLLGNKRFLVPLIFLTVYYLMWNLSANTWGSFQTYFMVTIGGRSQSYATAVGFIANVLAIITTYAVFVRFADTSKRYIVMIVGVTCGILSWVVSAFAGGQWMVFTICYVIYSITNTLHGEPIYKIWSQQLFPANARATATGFTYAIVRFLTAIFGFVTPSLMAYSPSLLLWILVGVLVLSLVTALCAMKFIRNHEIPDPRFNPKALNGTK
ncbi:major facilitator superfamily protein [Bifidobacterium tissieri]|uniref:Major facilitator superfamily protein n=1 Tax=Bifidobacterium tissieri TaxID=1630162 RepID=A0A261FH86_9BIFI|nr:MFS transporter [Bifidobacterium tissieri]OZG58514.1 major facilitator superfamily protein [Bifidobacterium tissieri]